MDKKILFVAPNLRVSNGVTSFIMGNYAFLLKNKYKVDFLLTKKVESPNNKFVEDQGSRIYVYPSTEHKYAKINGSYVRRILSENHYDIVHCNETGIYAYWAVKEADRADISHIIYHAHNPKETTTLKGRIREEIFDRICFLHTTDYFSCTEHAGKSVFGERKFYIIQNGVDLKKYHYNYEKGKKIKEKLNIENEIVIGTVCRQAEQKNPYFIVNVLKELNEIDNRFTLLWVGSGPLLEEVKKYADQKGVRQKILFLGDREDTCILYSAMDCFFLPSQYEGLGIVFLEAQASGLYCFASDAVPRETDISGNISYLKLSDSAALWAKQIISKLKTLEIDRDVAFDAAMATDVEMINTNNALVQTYQLLEG